MQTWKPILIPYHYGKLMIAVKEGIADSNVLKLLEQWLKSPIMEDGKYNGGKK